MPCFKDLPEIFVCSCTLGELHLYTEFNSYEDADQWELDYFSIRLKFTKTGRIFVNDLIQHYQC